MSRGAAAPATAGASLLERALRRDRLLVLSAVLFVTVLAWAWLLAGAGMSEIDGALQPLAGAWSLGDALVMLAMWAVMMAAMMLPSAAPMILLYATLARRGRERGAPAATSASLFGLGYLAVWAGYGVGATALQFALERAALLSPALHTTSIGLAGALLVGAGIYQWTPLKHTCLSHCRSPLQFIVAHWRPGAAGAWSMGVRHGSYCVGCCWLLMLLLFVGGVMNFAWIAGIALFVLIEKLLPAGHWIGRSAGLALVVWGIATLAALPLAP